MRPRGRVGLVGADDRVDDRLAVVVEGHDRPETDPRAGRRRFDDDRRAEARLDRLDPALEERLLLAGGVVLGVLLEVAVLLGGPDPGEDLRPPDPGQLVELGPEAGIALGGEGLGRGHRSGGPGASRAAAGSGASAAAPRPGSAGAASRAGASPRRRAARAEPPGVSARRVRHGHPRRRRPGRPRRGSAAAAASTGSAISEPRQPGRPCARRSAVRRFAHGRTTVRSGSAGQVGFGHAGREGRQQGVLVLLGRLGRRPPDPDPIERAKRLEPVAAGVRPPVAELGLADRRHPPTDRRVPSRRRTGRSAMAARTTPAGPPGLSTSVARRRAGASRPARSTCRRGSARWARSAVGAGSSMTKTPGPCAGTGRPQTAGPSASRPTERRSAAAPGSWVIGRWYRCAGRAMVRDT